MSDGYVGIDTAAALDAAADLRRVVEHIDWVLHELNSADTLASAGDLTAGARGLADEMRTELQLTAELLESKAEEIERIPYGVASIDILFSSHVTGLVDRLRRQLDNGVGADASQIRREMYAEGARWDFDEDDIDVLIAGSYFPIMLDRLGDLPETFEFFGLAHKTVQLEIAYLMQGVVTLECYVKGSGFADLCMNHEPGSPYSVAEVKPATPWSIRAGQLQLADRLLKDPTAVLAWDPNRDPIDWLWPDDSASAGMTGYWTDLVGVDLTWTKLDGQNGLYVYAFSALPTAPEWRAVRDKLRQTTANYAFSVIPATSYAPAGTSGYTTWTLDAPQAIFLGLSTAAAAATFLLLTGGVAVQPR